MEDFFGKALGVVKGNRGVIPIVVIFALSTLTTLILSKTTTLNASQSYEVLLFVFIGLMVFLILLYALFLKPQKEEQSHQKATTKGKGSGIKQATDNGVQDASTEGDDSPIVQTKKGK